MKDEETGGWRDGTNGCSCSTTGFTDVVLCYDVAHAVIEDVIQGVVEDEVFVDRVARSSGFEPNPEMRVRGHAVVLNLVPGPTQDPDSVTWEEPSDVTVDLVLPDNVTVPVNANSSVGSRRAQRERPENDVVFDLDLIGIHEDPGETISDSQDPLHLGFIVPIDVDSYYLVMRDTSLGILSSSASDISVKVQLNP